MTKIDRKLGKVERLRDLLTEALGKATVLSGEAIGDGDEAMQATIEKRVAVCIRDAIEGCRALTGDFLKRQVSG